MSVSELVTSLPAPRIVVLLELAIRLAVPTMLLATPELSAASLYDSMLFSEPSTVAAKFWIFFLAVVAE